MGSSELSEATQCLQPTCNSALRTSRASDRVRTTDPSSFRSTLSA
jgi:hypothetical protein